MFKNWNHSFPVYVTNKTAGGEIMTYSASAWLAVSVMMLALLNAFVWGIIGLVVAVKVIIP